MTTYTGKDVTLELDSTPITRVQEFSFEIDNGQIDVREVGKSTLQELNWTKQAVTGSMTIRPTNTGTYTVGALFDYVLPSDDLPTTQPTLDITVKFGTSPDWTLTLTDIGWGSISCSVGIEEPVEFEMPYTAKASTMAP